MDVSMIRTTLFSLLALGFASNAFAQSSLDGFEFPVFDESPSISTATKAPQGKKLITSESEVAPPIAPVPLPVPEPHLQQSSSAPQAEITSSGAANQYAGSAPPQMVQPFNGYMSYGPSPVGPLLAYMNCNQTACPDVWAGYAAQHAAEMAHYCSKHGCKNCGCGMHGGSLYAQPSIVPAGGHHHKLHHNRYASPSNLHCDACGVR